MYGDTILMTMSVIYSIFPVYLKGLPEDVWMLLGWYVPLDWCCSPAMLKHVSCTSYSHLLTL